MYEKYVFNGVFENMEIDIKEIVDNDYNNYCKVIDKTDDYFKIIKKKFKKEGYCDISRETPYSYIEATNEDNSKFLIRN